jgi:predicted RNase H-like HicB family nuclease
MIFVHVIYHHEADGWWADSPEGPGWTATADSVDKLRALAEDGVRFALDDVSLVIEHQLEGALDSAEVTYDFVLSQTKTKSGAGVLPRLAVTA